MDSQDEGRAGGGRGAKDEQTKKTNKSGGLP
jgi:hypothetical protein